ncbi:MAG: hypothetical protein PVG79_02655, partial [Gemmatimonadales bacterium]
MGKQTTVLFVLPDDEPTQETAAALAWLASLPGFDVQAIPLAGLSGEFLGHGVTVWFHWTEPPALTDGARRALDAHVRAGGGL